MRPRRPCCCGPGSSGALVARRASVEAPPPRRARPRGPRPRGRARPPGTPGQLGVEGATLEGYLFPETYRFARGIAPVEIARAMVEQFRAVWDGIAPLAREHGLSMRDVVILASLIEKETG